MANPRWGRKHTCIACGASFYDMLRNPITCPKCGVRHQPIVLLKSDGRPPRTNFVRSVPLPAHIAPAETPTASREAEAHELDNAAGPDHELKDALADEPVRGG